jgi:hypothetical protein
MATINTMLNSPSTTARSFADTGCYGCLQNTYSMANLIGFKSTTPSGSGSKYVTWPGTAICYLTAYGDGRITCTLDSGGVSTAYWFYLFGSGYSGNGYEVYCATGDGWGSVFGDTRDAWITLGTSKQWYLSTTGDASRVLYLYFRNTYFAQTSPGTWSLYAESLQ